ncbi:hypothetical protein [Halobellus sp. GM3]|uniref:hypothetical protein n=1 Tax=Halobellus sp. GM3 TaxID=3458410 RepID=UPI00403E2EBB
MLLDAHRYAVAGALLTVVFLSLMVIGTVWTFEMQQLLTETRAVETILTAFLRGIILLVSIVVSINSIILSHDITSVQTQRGRIEGVMEFRQRVGELSEDGDSPVDPASFLAVMAAVISRRASALQTLTEEEEETELSRDVAACAAALEEATNELKRESDQISGAEFGVLWMGMEFAYGRYLDWVDRIKRTHERELSDPMREGLDDLIRVLELFAIGKEYFKTLYYSREISQLSLWLLAVSLPAIISTAATILAINAGVLPETSVLGLPPLLSFVAAAFTVSLAPYLVLTAYMLRLVTVAKETARAGPFTLR